MRPDRRRSHKLQTSESLRWTEVSGYSKNGPTVTRPYEIDGLLVLDLLNEPLGMQWRRREPSCIRKPTLAVGRRVLSWRFAFWLHRRPPLGEQGQDPCAQKSVSVPCANGGCGAILVSASPSNALTMAPLLSDDAVVHTISTTSSHRARTPQALLELRCHPVQVLASLGRPHRIVPSVILQSLVFL